MRNEHSAPRFVLIEQVHKRAAKRGLQLASIVDEMVNGAEAVIRKRLGSIVVD